MKVYMAGALFTIQDRRFLEKIRETIKSAGFDTFLPHADNIDNAEGYTNTSRERLQRIFSADYKAIEGCDIMIAFLDGVPLDCGTTWEMGFAFARKMPILAVRTDFRTLGNFKDQKFDLMAEGSADKIIFQPQGNMSSLKEEIKSSLLALKKNLESRIEQTKDESSSAFFQPKK